MDPTSTDLRKICAVCNEMLAGSTIIYDTSRVVWLVLLFVSLVGWLVWLVVSVVLVGWLVK